MFIGLENGDIHEFNIFSCQFVKTFFLNFGKHPSFCFDDSGFFLLSLNDNLEISLYKKDFQITNLHVPVKRADRFFTFANNFSKKTHFQIHLPEKRKAVKDLSFFDLKNSIEPVSNKPVLSLKVSKRNFHLK